MKKILTLLLVLAMVFCLTACATVNEDGSPTPAGVAIEQGITVLARALEATLAVAATWALAKIGKRKELQNTQLALETLFDITRQTVGELQQMFVTDWKAAGGGKLNEEQKEKLRQDLFVLVKKKLDGPTQDLIIAAGADINALIAGAAEDWINTLKGYDSPAPTNDVPKYTTGPGVGDPDESAGE